MSDLKPCPFCGSEPNFQQHPQFGARYFCDFGPDHSIFIGGNTPDDAAANWNHRADPIAASHQRLKEALERISNECPEYQACDAGSIPSDFGNAEDYSLEMERIALSAIGDIARAALKDAP